MLSITRGFRRIKYTLKLTGTFIPAFTFSGKAFNYPGL
jgi:hypothetical protein